MHNKQLIRAWSRRSLAKRFCRMLPPACGIIRSGLCRLRGPRHKGTSRPTLKGNRYGRRPQARIFFVCDTGQGRSRLVLRGGAEIRAGGTEGAGANRRPGEAGGRRGTVHRQKRQFARHCGAGRIAGGAAGYPGGGQGRQAQGAGSGQAWRCRHGQGSSAGRRGRDLRGICQRRAQARPGGRDRTRHATARLCVRSLQDQAQRGRGGAGKAADHDRGEQSRRRPKRPGTRTADRSPTA